MGDEEEKAVLPTPSTGPVSYVHACSQMEQKCSPRLKGVSGAGKFTLDSVRLKYGNGALGG